MIDHVIKIAVLYNCRVARSGYKIREGERSSSVTRIPKLLLPNDPNTSYDLRKFTQETVNDFQSKIRLNRDEKEDDLDRLWFCNRWGPLISEKETDATFDQLRLQLRKYQTARANNKFLPFNIELKAKFDTNSEGKQIPAIEGRNLYHALETSWFLSFQHQMEVTMCQHFKDYGDRKDCQKYFPTRGIKAFCSIACRKEHWQKQKRTDEG